MLRFATDEGFNLWIVGELRRRNPDLDVATAQERRLYGSDDPTILAWAASEGRVLLTSDVRTMPGFAYQRMANNETTAVIVVPWTFSIGRAVEELELMAGASLEDEWDIASNSCRFVSGLHLTPLSLRAPLDSRFRGNDGSVRHPTAESCGALKRGNDGGSTGSP